MGFLRDLLAVRGHGSIVPAIEWSMVGYLSSPLPSPFPFPFSPSPPRGRFEPTRIFIPTTRAGIVLYPKNFFSFSFSLSGRALRRGKGVKREEQGAALGEGCCVWVCGVDFAPWRIGLGERMGDWALDYVGHGTGITLGTGTETGTET